MSKLKRRLLWLDSPWRNWVKRTFWLYDVSDLTVGGHCGCCGKWTPNAIVALDWRITLCDVCEGTRKWESDEQVC